MNCPHCNTPRSEGVHITRQTGAVQVDWHPCCQSVRTQLDAHGWTSVWGDSIDALTQHLDWSGLLLTNTLNNW